MAVSVEDHGADNCVEHHAQSIQGQIDVELRGRRNLVVIANGLQTDRPLRVVIDGSDNAVTLGEEIHLCGQEQNPLQRTRIAILGSRNRVALGRGCSGTFGVRISADDSEATVDAHCTAVHGRLHLLERARITLGYDCMLSANVTFQASDGHPIYDRDSGARINPPEDIRVGDHVWLGGGVRILKGVEIGSGSVIGTGAVVTRSIPANCIAVGVPARVVRENVEWRRDMLEFSARAKMDSDL